MCLIVLRLAPSEKVVQDKHFEVFTVAVTQKMTDIEHFENFNTISEKQGNFQKKSNISESVRVTDIL